MTPAPDLEGISWLRVLIAASTVLGLLSLLSLAMKYVASRGWICPLKQSGKRLHVIESLPLDARRRLVIIKCDETEHLLLLGPGQDRIIETNLSKPSPTLPSVKQP
jgi:flagellar protein FliO/FliZ